MATPTLSQSAKLYQERMLPYDRTTRRLPTPRLCLGENRVHTLPLKTPFPTVEVLHCEGDKPPDAGHTDRWPRGEEELA